MTATRRCGTRTCPSRVKLLPSRQIAVNGGEESGKWGNVFGYGRSPPGAGGMSPAAPGYSPSSPNAYSPTSPYVPDLPFSCATSPFGTSPYATSPFYDQVGARHLQRTRLALLRSTSLLRDILQRVRDTLRLHHPSLRPPLAAVRFLRDVSIFM